MASVIENYAKGLTHEQLLEEYLALVVRYDERGMAMQDTGDMVRSLYIPRIDKLLEALNKIAMLGMTEHAYTKDFTTKVNGIARSALQEDKNTKT